MTKCPALTKEQLTALSIIFKCLRDGKNVIALTGPAGSGKTTMIQEIKSKLGDDLVVSAMTNKAAGVLRQKNILDAITTHKACLKPILREPAKRLLAYFHSDDRNSELEDDLSAYYALSLLQNAWSAARDHGLSEAARLLDIHDFFEEFFEGWGPREERTGVLVIDEASMLGETLLKTILQTFTQVILVGDAMQLPPVNDDGVFLNDLLIDVQIPLSQIHRQALSSQPLALAHRVLTGKYIDMNPLKEIDLNLCSNGVPIIVWRNRTRISLTKAIRSALGYSSQMPMVGEYIVCRENRKSGKVEFANNSVWKVVKIATRTSYILEDSDGNQLEKPVHLFMEEYGAGLGLRSRFYYSLTCHCSQGSEWSTVMIHSDDARACLGMLQEDGRKLLYTAITRAKEKVIWVNSRIEMTRCSGR